MKHLAARLTSADGRRPFTATGLGDRIHHCTVAWVYGPPVTLHLAERHVTGGQFGNKRQSWDEVVSLFPPGAITIEVGGTGRLFRYGDFPAVTDTPDALDATPLLRDIPRLVAKPQDVELPDRFYTAQWDANGPARAVRNPPKLDLPTVIVGGEAEGALRWSLKTIAWAMSQAEGHVGVDSAFYHLARLYMAPERIRLYHRGASHHVLRAQASGVVCVRL